MAEPIRVSLVSLAQVPTQTEVENAVRELQTAVQSMATVTQGNQEQISELILSNAKQLQNVALQLGSLLGTVEGLQSRVESLEEEVFP